MKKLFILILAIITLTATAVTASATAYEAEDAILNGNATIVEFPKAYGGKVVETDGSVIFEFTVDTEDFYHIRVYYRNPLKADQTFKMSVHGRSVTFDAGNSSRGSRWFNVYLEPGEYTITVEPVSGYKFPQIDMAIVEYREDFGMGSDSGVPGEIPEVNTRDDAPVYLNAPSTQGGRNFFHRAFA